MRTFAKSILISILVTVAILLFTNFIYFFPWYTTLVVETFNVTQIVASDNYLRDDYKEDVLQKLQDRPIFNKKADRIKISARKEDDDPDHTAEGGDPFLYEDLDNEDDKPYRQRGYPVTVTISAVYPLTIKLWGEELEREVPVSFTLKTIGLKHYKDLVFYDDIYLSEDP